VARREYDLACNGKVYVDNFVDGGYHMNTVHPGRAGIVPVEHGQLATGMHLFFAESLDTFARDLQRARPTTFFSVPRLWVKFQQGIHATIAPTTTNSSVRSVPVTGVTRMPSRGRLPTDGGRMGTQYLCDHLTDVPGAHGPVWGYKDRGRESVHAKGVAGKAVRVTAPVVVLVAGADNPSHFCEQTAHGPQEALALDRVRVHHGALPHLLGVNRTNLPRHSARPSPKSRGFTARC